MIIHLAYPAAALEFLKTHPVDPIDTTTFEQCCGVGVVISQEEITQCVSAGFITEARGHTINIDFSPDRCSVILWTVFCLTLHWRQLCPSSDYTTTMSVHCRRSTDSG